MTDESSLHKIKVKDRSVFSLHTEILPRHKMSVCAQREVARIESNIHPPDVCGGKSEE